MLNKFSTIKPHTFFLTVSIFLFFCYALLVPPFQTPDEYNHFYRAYAVSQGDFIPQKKDNRLGGMVPVSFQDFITPFNSSNAQPKSKVSKEDVLRSFTVACEPDRQEFKDFPNTSYYTPVSYLPQALTLFVCGKLNASVGSMYYSGRTTAFIVWLLVIFFCIKIIPIGKWVLVFVNLLPMQLFISNSFSADTVTNILAFLWLSLILKLFFTEDKLSLKMVLLLMLIACLLALAKVIYVVLVLMVFILPAAKFKNGINRLAIISAILLPSLLLAKWWSGLVTQNFLSYETYNHNARHLATLLQGADYFLQTDALAHQPWLIPGVLYNSIILNPEFYLTSYIGFFGSFMDTPLPTFVCVIAYTFLGLITLLDRNKLRLTPKNRIIILATFFLLLSALILSLYLTWCKVGNAGLEHLQGRYLAPVIPLLLLGLTGSSQKHQWNLTPLVFVSVVFLNVYAGSLLYDRYFKENYATKTEFFHTFEDGTLNTSPYKSKLSSTKRFDGNYSLMLENEQSEVTFLKFNKIKQGDWLLFEGMRFGSAGRLQIQCIKNEAEIFNWVEEWPKYEDSKGWEKLKMVVIADKDLDSVQIRVNVINNGNEPVYFDNLHFVNKTY